MFDVGASELLLIVIVAVVVIGPKDLPLALRTAGRWIGKIRRVSGHFRSGLETMIREAELEEMERKWREQNEAIMTAHPTAHPDPAESVALPAAAATAEAGAAEAPKPRVAAKSPAASKPTAVSQPDAERAEASPQLPLSPP